jgi:hypothetical protein
MSRGVTDDDLERIRRFVDRPKRDRDPEMLCPEDDVSDDESESTALQSSDQNP